MVPVRDSLDKQALAASTETVHSARTGCLSLGKPMELWGLCWERSLNEGLSLPRPRAYLISILTVSLKGKSLCVLVGACDGREIIRF